MTQFFYTVDVTAEKPVMLINKHIGFDETDGVGIMGDQFQAELMALDAMGKSGITVVINSPGGTVIDGMSIYSAILDSTIPVDTKCVGIAASIAGVIFQAGKNRIMSDYGLLMYHNPEGGDDEELNKIRESLITMITSRTGKTTGEVSAMMDKTTWITADEAITSGLCDNVENSEIKNALSINVKMAWKQADAIVNNAFKKNTPMHKITNRLGLNETATEDAIVAEIENILNKSKNTDDKLNELQQDYDDKCKTLAALAKECDAIKEELDKIKQEADDKANKDVEEKATAALNKAVAEGKIVNKPEVVARWKDSYKANPELAERMLATIPINRKSTVDFEAALKEKADTTKRPASKINEINARSMQRYNERMGKL
jgi:ATP-dependent protease ClpP protease subunit